MQYYLTDHLWRNSSAG
ncbi:hypothetical protein GPL15_25165 [Clostridium sp. MCC353]|nr:hypothetical protein [Clostridium sp. MCC353]